MGLEGVSKSQVSRLCAEIDGRVRDFLGCPVEGDWPTSDSTPPPPAARRGRIVSIAAILAVAVDTEGRLETVGLHIGPSEAEIVWATFLRSLVKRGLRRSSAGRTRPAQLSAKPRQENGTICFQSRQLR